MSLDPLLDAAWRRSTGLQRLVLRGLAAVSLLFGLALSAGLLLAPPKPKEAAAGVVVGLFALVFMLFGVGMWAWVGTLMGRLRGLLAQPTGIQRMQLLLVRRRQLRVWTIHLWDARGGPVGLLVADEAAGRQVMDRLRELGARDG